MPADAPFLFAPMLRWWVFVLLFLLPPVGCGSWTKGATAETPGVVRTTVELEAEAVVKLNGERQVRRLPVLGVDERLAAAARAHSRDMAVQGFFDHSGSDGSLAGERISRQGYRWRFYAENIACGQRSADEVVADWMASPDHRTNILSDSAEQVGIGVVLREGSDCTCYWTAVFAAEQQP